MRLNKILDGLFKALLGTLPVHLSAGAPGGVLRVETG